MRLAPWLVLPTLVGAFVFACATGNDGSTTVRPYYEEDASAGGTGEGGSAGGPANGGGAGMAQGGNAPGGSAGAGGSSGEGGGAGTGAGGAGNGGTAGTGGAGGAGGSNNCTLPVPTGKCDTIPQCGCDATQGCYVTNYTTGATSCLTAGTVGKGQTCAYTKSNECAPGTECVGYTCKPFCHSASDCQTGGADCIPVQSELSDGGAMDIPAWNTCTDQCDPSVASSCASGQNCIPIDDINVTPGHSLCTKAGTSTGACTSSSDCAASYVCMGDNLCHKWCKEGAVCAGGLCSQLQDSSSNIGYLYVGTVGFGVCP